jgi:beta-phosphoglucomutase
MKHIDFTLEHNELLKGVSRVRSLDIILEIGKVELQEDKTNGCFKK